MAGSSGISAARHRLRGRNPMTDTRRGPKHHVNSSLLQLLATTLVASVVGCDQHGRTTPPDSGKSEHAPGKHETKSAPQDGGDSGPGSEDVWNPPEEPAKGDPDLSAQDPRDRMCAPILVQLGTRDDAACSPETGTCVVACADNGDGEACRDTCAAGDTYRSPSGVACDTCLTVRTLSCFADRGCSTKSLYCCIDDRCGGVGGPEGCVDAMCQAQLRALTTCVTSTPEALGCLDFEDGPVSSCFASYADHDAGV